MRLARTRSRYLCGALNAKTGRLTWVEWDREDSDLFIPQLWQLVGYDYSGGTMHPHYSGQLLDPQQPVDADRAGLPGRLESVCIFCRLTAADHNRIERLWRDLHDNVTRNHRCRTTGQLMEEALAYLTTREQALRHEYATYSAA